MFFHRFLRLLVCVPAVLGAFFSTVVAADFKTLPGHVPREISSLKAIGPLAATNVIRLAIGVPLRDAPGLDAFLSQVYAPDSPSYRNYLTPKEFTARFGPTEQDYEAVKRFAIANGLAIVQTHDNRLVLDVAGPPAAVEKAFNVKLHRYQHPVENREFFAPDTEPSVSVDLPVADVQGISDFARPYPKFVRKTPAARGGTSTPAVAPNSTIHHGGSAPDGSGSFFGDDFRHAYASDTTLTGAGQKVGVLEFDGYYASDIAAYASAAGGGRGSIALQPVLLDGFDGVPTTGPNSGNGEVSLDIEMAMAMAPGLAAIKVYEAGPYGLQNDILNAMAADTTVKSFSCCWGWSGGPNTTTDNIFKELDAQGQSFFNASGDSDAFTVGANSVNAVDDPNSANAPSSCPYITQVGGTELAMNGNGASFASESVWNWGGGTGSSGGVSSYYAIPAWQSGMSMTASHGSTAQRNIPDVALTGDNVFVYDSNGSADVFGGTSCATPLWAGFIALVNQQAAGTGRAVAGFINPAIYAIGKGQNSSYSYANCFHDTISGNNFWSSSPSQYAAAPGYDLCTGWGTPNGMNLINALAGPASTLSFSAQSSYAFSGPVGGPFVPATQTFSITNNSAAAVSWSLISTSAWAKADITNGTVAPGNVATVTISIGSAANSLKAGSYSASLAFGNSTASAVQRIPVTLQVNNAVSVSPSQGFMAIGPVGGPFAPASQVFTLANASGTAVTWSLRRISVPWLTASSTAGTIPAHGQATVTVSLSSAAKSLRAGVYTTSLTLATPTGTLAAFSVTASIGQPLVKNGGFENGNLTGWTQTGNTQYTEVMRANSSYVHSGLYGLEMGPSGSPGYLSQTVATVSGQTYAVSVWLRNAKGSTPNSFQILWNGATVFTLDNLASQNWTNVLCLVTATSTASVLQLGFQDDPDYLGMDDISLNPVSGASVRAGSHHPGHFDFSWDAAPESVYQVQYKTNLSQGDWADLGGPISAPGGTLTISDTNARSFSTQRFYRVLKLR
jgi:subtilase family serine protease